VGAPDVGDEILAALGEQHAELEGLLRDLDGGEWELATPCEGWTVADVVLHLAQTDELAVASATGRFPVGLERLAGSDGPTTSVDDSAAALVAEQRGAPPSELLERWRVGSRALQDALVSGDPHRRVRWVAGELSVRTLATTRLAETWIHTGDVAAATGTPLVPTERLRHVARLAWRTLPYAFARAGRTLVGPVALELRSPSGETWEFHPEGDATTVIRGDGAQWCLVAARRMLAADTDLRADGPDGAAVLDLVRTYA
jgi:uncharacterized protein (TIGR03084 family)